MTTVIAKLKLAFVFDEFNPYHLLTAADRKVIQAAIDAEVYGTLPQQILDAWEEITVEFTEGPLPEKQIEQRIRDEVAKTSSQHSLAVVEDPCPTVTYNYHGGMKCCTHEYALTKKGSPWRVVVKAAGATFTLGLGIALNWETATTATTTSKKAGG